jgi:hypothetical protein
VVGPVTIVGDEARVSIEPFVRTIGLGRIPADVLNTLPLSYSMSAEVPGVGLNGTGGLARLGGPFDLSGSPGSLLSIEGVSLQPATVPEPAALLLMGAGLAAIVVARSRARARRAPRVSASRDGRRV